MVQCTTLWTKREGLIISHLKKFLYCLIAVLSSLFGFVVLISIIMIISSYGFSFCQPGRLLLQIWIKFPLILWKCLIVQVWPETQYQCVSIFLISQWYAKGFWVSWCFYPLINILKWMRFNVIYKWGPCLSLMRKSGDDMSEFTLYFEWDLWSALSRVRLNLHIL